MATGAASAQPRSPRRFAQDLLCNGSLEVYSADSETLLGRTDPYIGHNIDLAGSVANIDRSIEQLRAQLREADGETALPN